MARTDRLVEDLQPLDRPWSLWDQGYRMVDAEIEFTDRTGGTGPRVLLWQTLDIAPDYPVLQAGSFPSGTWPSWRLAPMGRGFWTTMS